MGRSMWMQTMIAGPARGKCIKWMGRYKALLKKKWPELEGEDDHKLDVLASAFLDTMTQAGGRSVPLAIDLTLGYILMECMRFHPPVTVIPTWVREEEDSDEWHHELICVDRTCADPEVFPDPDEFRLDRNPACHMAWADFAYVNGDKAHPHSHGCPGKELSISMTVAFVMAYQAAGPWDVDAGKIQLNFYGTKGFKCTK